MTGKGDRKRPTKRVSIDVAQAIRKIGLTPDKLAGRFELQSKGDVTFITCQEPYVSRGEANKLARRRPAIVEADLSDGDDDAGGD